MDIVIVPYRLEHFEGLDQLWKEAFPDDTVWNRAALSVPAKLEIQPELLLVAVDGERVLGSIMAGYDGHRGWLYAVAVLSGFRGRGIGMRLVRTAERRLHELGCLKINLKVRSDNAEVVSFYERAGYVVEDRISMGKRVPAEPVR